MERTVERTAGATIARMLGDDSQEIDGLLVGFRAMIADHDGERARTRLQDLSDRLLHHIHVEDEVLLPILDRRVPHFHPSPVMRLEHQRIAALLPLLAGQLEERGALLEQLERLLADHRRHEEQVLYPFADDELSDEERERVSLALGQRRQVA